MSLTLGGKRPNEFGVKITKDTSEPVLPEMRNQTLQIAGRHGLYDFGGTLGQRPFELACALVEQNNYGLQYNVRKLAAHLVNGDGRPKIMDLIFDDEPDKVYRARYAGNIPIDRLAGLGTFTIPMVAYDPFAYLIEDAVDVDVDSAIVVDNDITVDAVYVYNVTAAQTVEVDNFGTQNAQPIIEVTGSFDTLSITANGTTFNYNAALSSGQTLTINCADYTANVDGSNTLGNVTGDFIELPVGVVPVEIDGANLNIDITFKFKPKFV